MVTRWTVFSSRSMSKSWLAQHMHPRGETPRSARSASRPVREVTSSIRGGTTSQNAEHQADHDLLETTDRVGEKAVGRWRTPTPATMSQLPAHGSACRHRPRAGASVGEVHAGDLKPAQRIEVSLDPLAPDGHQKGAFEHLAAQRACLVRILLGQWHRQQGLWSTEIRAADAENGPAPWRPFALLAAVRPHEGWRRCCDGPAPATTALGTTSSPQLVGGPQVALATERT